MRSTESGPYTGLTLGQVLNDCPDIAYNSSLVRGRGNSAAACRAFLKVLKAHEELSTSLKTCDTASAKVQGKQPRNSKTPPTVSPLTDSLALVPYGSAAASKPSVALKGPTGASEATFRFNPRCSWEQIRRWFTWLACSVFALCLPKVPIQLAGLFL